MKKGLVVILVLFLTACIDVDDFGAAWNKTSLDPALEGRWRKISDEGSKAGQEWVFTVKDGAYSVQTYLHGKPDDVIYPVKTLNIGPYHFLVKGPDKGSMIRYTINGSSSTFYEIDSKNAWTFFKKNYPNADNIYKEEPEDTEDWDNLENAPWKIADFGDDVFTALAHLPDNEMFWHQDTELAKVK